MIKTHSLRPPSGLKECAFVLDIGPGIRPFNWYKPKHHVCVEPHGAYCDILRKNGYEVIQDTALKALKFLSGEAIYLLDVVEHMEKGEALEVIWMAKEHSTVQVVIYTPFGFVPQEHDAWNLGGEYWQKHRSGWQPEDFPGWKIEGASPGFFAIYDH